MVTTKLDEQWINAEKVHERLWSRHNKMKELSDSISDTINDIRRQVNQALDYVDMVQVCKQTQYIDNINED